MEYGMMMRIRKLGTRIEKRNKNMILFIIM
jgi:hypothetical protein